MHRGTIIAALDNKGRCDDGAEALHENFESTTVVYCATASGVAARTRRDEHLSVRRGVFLAPEQNDPRVGVRISSARSN